MTHPDVRFGLLGPLTVRRGDLCVQIPGGRQRVLLAALLLKANRAVETTELAEAIWDGKLPVGATNTLRSYVMRLRRSIGPVLSERILRQSSGYMINIEEDDELDVSLYYALRERGRAARRAGDWRKSAADLRAAIELWRGPPLIDVPSDRLRREHVACLEESHVQALEWRMDAELAMGRHEEILAELIQLTMTYPLRERLHVLRMRALCMAGRQAEAIATFQDVRRLLIDELGVEPGAELQELYQQVLNSTPARDLPGKYAGRLATPRRFPPPSQLPGDLADFTGRRELVCCLVEMAEWAADCRPGETAAVPVAAIVGMAGIGKTATAVHAAHLARPYFPDGQFYVNLRGSSAEPASPAAILTRLLRDLGADPAAILPEQDERASQYRSLLSGRRMLIVLDDARDTAQIRPLLPGTPGCMVLVTSRTRMVGFETALIFDLESLNARESRELFDRIIGPRRAALEPESTAAVLNACAGLPLAIRAAACRIAARPAWTVGTLMNQLADERRRLDELRAGDLSVQASFAVSYASLPQLAGRCAADPARAFRILSLAKGPDISLAAAAAMLGLPRDATRQALELLVDVHLLESPTARRYRFHDLLRLYARECAQTEDDPADLTGAIRNLLTWYTHAAATFARASDRASRHILLPVPPAGKDPLIFADRAEASRWMDAERANLTAAISQAGCHGFHDIALGLSDALGDEQELVKVSVPLGNNLDCW